MQIQVLPETEAQRNSFGAQFSKGLNQGLNYALQNMLEEKQQTRQMARQRAINSDSALSLADSFGLTGKAKKSFVEQFSHISPEKQIPALKSFAESQILNKFLQEENNDVPESSFNRKNLNPPSENDEIPQINPEMNADNEKNPPENTYKIKAVLPIKPKKFPPIGITARAAAMEQQRYDSERNMAFKETKQYRDAIDKQGEAAERSAETLNRLDKLIESGKLANPLIASAAKKYDLVGLLSPESQLFEKTMGEFLPSMADTYGARVTNQHEKIFLNTLPRLQQTDSGKKLLVKVLKKKNEADNIKYNIKKEILRETESIPPLNLRDMVEERSRPLLEKNYDDVLKIISSGAEQTALPGTIAMVDKYGAIYDIPESEVEFAKQKELQPL